MVVVVVVLQEGEDPRGPSKGGVHMRVNVVGGETKRR